MVVFSVGEVTMRLKLVCWTGALRVGIFVLSALYHDNIASRESSGSIRPLSIVAVDERVHSIVACAIERSSNLFSNPVVTTVSR